MIRYLGAVSVGEATASVHRTQLAVVRRKYTNSRVTHKWDSNQTRPADTMSLLVPFSLLFSTTGIDQALTEGFEGYRVGFNLLGQTDHMVRISNSYNG
jgi:hypothetical protein